MGFLVPAHLGYGSNGRGSIPWSGTYFDIKLIKVELV
jgi:FKBP-type peptidyl-prolyl cis-trans isomerase